MDDIVNFVPIENNQNDFQLAELLNDIDKDSIMNQTAQNTVAKTDESVIQQQRPMTPLQRNTYIPNVWNMNLAQSQNYPFVPQMWSPNSNVTINYNFGNPPPK